MPAAAQTSLNFPPAATRRRDVTERQFSMIRFMRGRGVKVYRWGGLDFLVGGRILDAHEMARFAKALGWQA